MPKRHRPGSSAASLLRHVEEVVVATSGEDAFEIVFAVAAARIAVEPRLALRRALAEAARRFPMLEIATVHQVGAVQRVNGDFAFAFVRAVAFDAVRFEKRLHHQMLATPRLHVILGTSLRLN